MNGAKAGFCYRSGAVGAMKAAEVNDARAGFFCRSGAVGAMKAAEVHGARDGFCCHSGAVVAMKAAEVHGARAEFCCRSRYMAPGPSLTAVGGTWRQGRVFWPERCRRHGGGGCGHRGGSEGNRGSGVRQQCTGCDKGRCG